MTNRSEVPATAARPMIPLVKAHITDIDRAYMTRRVAEGLLDDETEVARLERAFASHVGVAAAVAVSSGTGALEVALQTLGVGPGDEVIIPSYTCVALLHAVVARGGTPILIDNDRNVTTMAYHVSTAAIARAITPRTRAAIVSHMFGTVASIDDWSGLGVPIVEDFTLSLGADHHGRRAGSLGRIGVCSLHRSKMISGGRGGILVSDDPALVERARALAYYDTPVADWRYETTDGLRGTFQPAWSYGLGELQAALGNSQLTQLDSFVARRQQLAARYTRAFALAGIGCPRPSQDRSNVFYRYLIHLDKPVYEVLRALQSAGIEGGRGVFPPLHTLLGLPDADYPTTSSCVEHTLSVPLHPAITDDQADFVIEQVLAVVT